MRSPAVAWNGKLMSTQEGICRRKFNSCHFHQNEYCPLSAGRVEFWPIERSFASFHPVLLLSNLIHIRGTVLPKAKANQSTEFGLRLKQLRESRSLNVAEFAKRVQASPAAIWHWENRGTRPRIGALNAIAQVLGVPRSFLETGESVDGENENSSAPSALAEMSLEQLMKAIEAKGFDVCVRSKADTPS